MTQYRQTVGKNSDWESKHNPQTGLPFAIPALGGAAKVLGGAGTALGLGSLASKGSKVLNLGGKAAKTGGKAAGSAGAANIAKAGVAGYALHEFNNLMDSSPKIGGVPVLPVAIVGGSAMLTGHQVMNGKFNPFVLLPALGAGIYTAVTQL